MVLKTMPSVYKKARDWTAFPGRLDYAAPIVLDTPNLVAWANAVRERYPTAGWSAWKLGDHCPYRPVNRAVLRELVRGEAQARRVAERMSVERSITERGGA